VLAADQEWSRRKERDPLPIIEATILNQERQVSQLAPDLPMAQGIHPRVTQSPG
jgi:hypothetical protein